MYFTVLSHTNTAHDIQIPRSKLHCCSDQKIPMQTFNMMPRVNLYVWTQILCVSIYRCAYWNSTPSLSTSEYIKSQKITMKLSVRNTRPWILKASSWFCVSIILILLSLIVNWIFSSLLCSKGLFSFLCKR